MKSSVDIVYKLWNSINQFAAVFFIYIYKKTLRDVTRLREIKEAAVGPLSGRFQVAPGKVTITESPNMDFFFLNTSIIEIWKPIYRATKGQGA